MDGATIGIVLGVVLGVLAVAAFSGFLYMRQKKKRSRLTTEATFNQKGKTAVAPQSNRIFRSQSVYVMSHDANDMNARRIISRTRSGLSLIFNEFDRDGDGQISEDEFKEFLAALPIRTGCDAGSVPDEIEGKLIFEALDDDASGKISREEWNVWVLDGLGQAPAYRAAAISKGGLPAKMDMMLCCLEIMAQDAGKRERQLKKNLTAIEAVESDVNVKLDTDAVEQVESSNQQRDSKGRKKKDNSLMSPNGDAPTFSDW